MSEPGLDEAFEFLSRTDPDFKRALTLISPLPSRQKPPGFSHLCKIIIEQQVSLASAAAIWGRFEAAIGPISPANLQVFTEDELRALGLSRQKARYCHALANDITEGRLDLEALSHQDDAAAMAALITVKGIGRWTAEIYLMSCLGRQDVWPAGDVALQIALQHLKDLTERPGLAEMDTHAEKLRPYRTIAARILWRYYSDVVKPPTRDVKKSPA